MKDKTKSILMWVIAVAFTLSLVIYQRSTGPTYPISGKVEVGSETIKFKLLRTHDTDIDAPVEVKINDQSVTGQLAYKRYKSYDEWTTVEMERNEEGLITHFPFLPPAGKMEYNVVLFKDGAAYKLNDEPVILRFKGAVPAAVLAPHIFFMFFSLLFGVRAGLEAIFRRKDTLFQVGVTLVSVIIGGLILGPINSGANCSKICF